jgi:transcriptional regulator with XRE-family HTH domain
MMAFNKESIKALRSSKKMTLEEFAAKAGGGLQKQHISKWEKGLSMPRIESLLRIVNTFNVPIDFFFTKIATTVAVDKKKKAE